jgi:hypothetical protein
MTNSASVWAFSTFLALGILLSGCPSKQPECAPGQYYDGANCIQGGGMGGGQCPPGQMWNGSMCAPAGGGSCPPGQVWNGSMCVASAGGSCPPGQTWNGSACVGTAPPPPPAGGGACSTQSDPTASTVATQALTLLAQQYAPPGARAVGSAIAGNMSAGQCMEQQVQLQPGKCYTVIGTAISGGEVDVELTPPLAGLPAVAVDQKTGPVAVLGEKPNCFKWAAPLAAPMRMVLKMPSGGGMAGAQLFEK